ncbi:MAG TPA: hypothetical protein VFK79_10985 [Xanthobacteraceae bacterium]|nr:hypothetical protein [Xanthobacteraceae bacterium]
MRCTFAVLAFATAFLSATSAGAERRMFIIANNADGYGVDRCLASGASCGAAIATAYCRAREFRQAVSYRKVNRDDITGAAPTGASGSCRGINCDDYVAIECAR